MLDVQRGRQLDGAREWQPLSRLSRKCGAPLGAPQGRHRILGFFAARRIRASSAPAR